MRTITLQAKRGDNPEMMSLSLGVDVREQLQDIIRFLQDTIRVNVSLSVIARRAISTYHSYLIENVIDSEGIKAERLEVFKASGKPSKAEDKRYRIINHNQP